MSMMDSVSIVKVGEEPKPAFRRKFAFVAGVFGLPSQETALAHRFAFWLAVFAFVAGVSNT